VLPVGRDAGCIRTRIGRIGLGAVTRIRHESPPSAALPTLADVLTIASTERAQIIVTFDTTECCCTSHHYDRGNSMYRQPRHGADDRAVDADELQVPARLQLDPAAGLGAVPAGDRVRYDRGQLARVVLRHEPCAVRDPTVDAGARIRIVAQPLADTQAVLDQLAAQGAVRVGHRLLDQTLGDSPRRFGRGGDLAPPHQLRLHPLGLRDRVRI